MVILNSRASSSRKVRRGTYLYPERPSNLVRHRFRERKKDRVEGDFRSRRRVGPEAPSGCGLKTSVSMEWPGNSSASEITVNVCAQ